MTDQNELLAPPKRGELAKKAAAKRAPAKKSAAKKNGANSPSSLRKGTQSLGSNIPSPKQSDEPLLSPLDIIGNSGTMPPLQTQQSNNDDDDEYSNMNKIINDSGSDNINNLNEIIPGEKIHIPDSPEYVSEVRKVAIKKIDHFNFRLGMEKTPEKHKLVPGTSHTWMCDKKGNEFVTGLENLPDVRKRLERKLRVDLSPTSDFWSTLTFEMEDKEHGQIMNFDDVQMGPHYEVVYYAMLASSIIANGLHEYNSGAKPMADWYIENKEAEVEAKEKEMTIDMDAKDAFGNMAASRRAKTARLLGLKVYGLKDKTAGIELWDHIKQKTEHAKKFLDLAKLGDSEFNVSVLVKDAIRLNVIRLDRARNLTFADQVLGAVEGQVVSKLMLATNSNLRLAIERQVEAKN